MREVSVSLRKRHWLEARALLNPDVCLSPWVVNFSWGPFGGSTFGGGSPLKLVAPGLCRVGP